MTTKSDDLLVRLREFEGWDVYGRPNFVICDEAADRIEELEALIKLAHPPRRWNLGALVKKKSGAEWHGCVVGFYSTDLTPIGYCVASAFEENSVQIYPENALEDWHV